MKRSVLFHRGAPFLLVQALVGHVAASACFVLAAGLPACSSTDTQVAVGNDGGSTYVPPSGDPIEAEALVWTWVPFEGAKCRDGSTAGIAISPNPDSDKLMIFLEGGGACFNPATCAANPANFDPANVASISGGVLDRTQTENPVKDWNMVYVPYCTGDVHGGSAEDVTVPGVTGTQQFVGYENMELFLDRVVPTFPDVKQVLDTGISAGGFGAAVNVELIQRKFPPGTDIVLIDDSGPGMSSEYIPSCLQKLWTETWGFGQTFLKDCGADCPNNDDFGLDWSFHLAKKYPDSRGALVSATADNTVTLFYGFGANDCSVAPTALPTPMPADQFKAGLLDFRTRIQAVNKNFSTYYIDSTTHTWTHFAEFYTTESGGVRLVDWYKAMLEGGPAQHVGP